MDSKVGFGNGAVVYQTLLEENGNSLDDMWIVVPIGSTDEYIQEAVDTYIRTKKILLKKLSEEKKVKECSTQTITTEPVDMLVWWL